MNEHDAFSTSNHQRREDQVIARALQAGPLRRVLLAAPPAYRVFRDPRRTDEVLLLALAVNAGRVPDVVMRFVSEPHGAELLHTRPSIDTRSVDYDALRRLPADTLGGAYVRFLDENDLSPDVFQTPGTEGPIAIRFLAQRLRQTHDLWHVVTGYATDERGEILLQAFTWAQLGVPSARLIAVLGLVRNPSLAVELVEAYRRGKRAQWFAAVPWEQMWERPLAEVRAELAV